MTWDPEKVRAALIFAAVAHKDQKIRDRDLPYTLHFSLVAMEVMAAVESEQIEDPDLAIQTACLHDVLEDTGVGFDELAQRFGTPVARCVLALTKNEKLETKALQMEDSLARVLAEARETALVKLADRITNLMEPPPSWDLEKRRYYREEAQVIHDALQARGPVLARRLQVKIDAYAQWC